MAEFIEKQDKECTRWFERHSEVTKERDSFKAQVDTFRKNAPKLMRKNKDGELVPVEAVGLGILPMLMEALGAGGVGRDFQSALDQLNKAKDMTDIQKYVLGMLQNPAGLEGADLADIAKRFQSMVPDAEHVIDVEPIEAVTRYRHTNCPHDGQKCRHDCEPGECWRELDGS